MKQTHRLTALLLSCALVLVSAGPVSAHRVNIFALVTGDSIEAECGFSSGQPARTSPIDVVDTATGTVLCQVVTDNQGRAVIPVSQAMRDAKQGLTLRLNAGEGHQNTWPIDRDELNVPASGTPAMTAGPASASSADVSLDDATNIDRNSLNGQLQSGLSRDELKAVLEATVRTAVAEELVPLRRELVRQSRQEPGLRDIVGGLGWIIGLAGLAAWYTGRRNKS